VIKQIKNKKKRSYQRQGARTYDDRNIFERKKTDKMVLGIKKLFILELTHKIKKLEDVQFCDPFEPDSQQEVQKLLESYNFHDLVYPNMSAEMFIDAAGSGKVNPPKFQFIPE